MRGVANGRLWGHHTRVVLGDRDLEVAALERLMALTDESVQKSDCKHHLSSDKHGTR